jgi:isochorismate pyruvate lyase
LNNELGDTALNNPSEPVIDGAPVRRFKNPNYQNVGSNLAELRQKIDLIDSQIIELLAQRALCVQDATRFKKDAFQVAAPARQAQVFERVRSQAETHLENFPNFPEIVETTYRTLVAGFIASEQLLFQKTEIIKK